MTNAEAWFNIALRPRKPEGSFGRTAQDGHLDSHTAPERGSTSGQSLIILYLLACQVRVTVAAGDLPGLCCHCVRVMPLVEPLINSFLW